MTESSQPVDRNQAFRDNRPVEPDEPRVLYSVAEGIAHVEINRPLLLNAMNAYVHEGIQRGMAEADADDDVRVVVLSGRGRAFSAGGDRGQSAEERAAAPKITPVDTGLAIWNCRKPVIAAVQGYCLGQGAELAAIADITIAADDARFGEVQINMGVGPPIFSAPFTMGMKQVKEYMFTGNHLDAYRAKEVGLVNHVVPRDRLLDEAMLLAARIVSLPPKGVQGDKRLINGVYERAGILDALQGAAEVFGK